MSIGSILQLRCQYYSLLFDAMNSYLLERPRLGLYRINGNNVTLTKQQVHNLNVLIYETRLVLSADAKLNVIIQTVLFRDY